jgi:hypothetical protein
MRNNFKVSRQPSRVFISCRRTKTTSAPPLNLSAVILPQNAKKEKYKAKKRLDKAKKV